MSMSMSACACVCSTKGTNSSLSLDPNDIYRWASTNPRGGSSYKVQLLK